MDRRGMLKAALGGCAAALGRDRNAGAESAGNAPAGEWARPIIAYVRGLARPDGGFGWDDQPDSHLSPTFAAIGCLHRLGALPADRQALARFVRTHHPITGEDAEAGKHAAELRTFVCHQIQGLLWLGEDVSSFHETVEGWTAPSKYPATYEPRGYPIFRQEMMAFVFRERLSLPLDAIAPELIAYLDSRRRPNGSFNNTPAADGSDGHVFNTWVGLQALRALGRLDERRAETIAWLRACQRPSGGFTWQPGATIGAIDDVDYARAAVRALQMLGAEPADPAACVRWLASLWNADGGFGDRPGLPSRPEATFFALDALTALGATPPPVARKAASAPARLPDDLQPFTLQIEAQGNGSPIEAVDLARALRIHLWGAKNARPEWIARAQAIADARDVPVTFFVSNEEYGTFVDVPGLGTYSHTSDPIAPAGVDFGPSRANLGPTPWPAFRDGRIGALERAGGRMVWQICDNEEWSRVQLDDSVERGVGYKAISTFHFAQNFVYMLPFAWRYRHLIPFVALQDAHGREAWWNADELAGYRTLFLARAPTWEGWLEALERQWVVAVRHDAVTRFRTRLLGGAPGVQEFMRRRAADWRWWGQRPDDMRRPLVSVVALTPDDAFEEGRPETGVAIRVRCWWQGRVTLMKPIVELVRLTIDGNEVTPEIVARREPKAGKQGPLVDRYAYYQIARPTPGRHTAAATVRLIETQEERIETVEFQVS